MEGGKIAELGSGFGKIALLLARKYPHLKVEAYELSPIPFLFSFFLSKLFRLRNLEIKREDFLKSSFADLSLAYAYLCPKLMEEIKKKCELEKPQFLLISSTFRLPGWQATKIVPIDDLYSTPLNFYDLKRVLESTSSTCS